MSSIGNQLPFQNSSSEDSGKNRWLMPVHYHAVLWIDHHEARIIHFNADEAEEKLVHPAHPPRHLHVKAGSSSGTHVTDEPQFYRDVADAVADAHEILVGGPS